MNVFNAIETRRSVKHYESSAAVKEEDFQRIIEATMLSPTSFNIQHWRFVRVTDPAIRQQIRAAAWDQAQVTDASELIILCADTQAWNTHPERYWSAVDTETRATILGMMQGFYTGKTQLQRDEAIRSCGLAAQTLMLSAKALGYDTCPMIGFDEAEVARIINLPEQHVIGMMLTLGVAAQPANPRSGSLPLNEVLLENGFSA